MLSTKSKLRLTGAFAALLTLALASCQGFFPPHVLQSITLQPTAPSFEIGYTQTMQAWGTDQNNDRYQLTTGVSWSLSNPSSGTVATINENTGTMTGVNAGTITVTASSEGLSATGTATVFEVITAMTISPTSGSVPNDDNTTTTFTVYDQNSNNISGNVTLTAYPAGQTSGTPVSGIECSYDSTNNDQLCLAETTVTPASYTIVVTAAGYTGSAVTATLDVTQAP